MNHWASPRFWSCYHRLPEEVRRLADRSYETLRNDPHDPSLHFKKVGALWSARVGLHYRAVAVEDGADMIWVWIGTHAEYDRIVKTGGAQRTDAVDRAGIAALHSLMVWQRPLRVNWCVELNRSAVEGVVG